MVAGDSFPAGGIIFVCHGNRVLVCCKGKNGQFLKMPQSHIDVEIVELQASVKTDCNPDSDN